MYLGCTGGKISQPTEKAEECGQRMHLLMSKTLILCLLKLALKSYFVSGQVNVTCVNYLRNKFSEEVKQVTDEISRVNINKEARLYRTSSGKDY